MSDTIIIRATITEQDLFEQFAEFLTFDEISHERLANLAEFVKINRIEIDNVVAVALENLVSRFLKGEE